MSSDEQTCASAPCAYALNRDKGSNEKTTCAASCQALRKGHGRTKGSFVRPDFSLQTHTGDVRPPKLQVSQKLRIGGVNTVCGLATLDFSTVMSIVVTNVGSSAELIENGEHRRTVAIQPSVRS